MSTKILLPVDGSDAAMRATRKAIEMAGWCDGALQVEMLAVHAPLPRFPSLASVVSDEMIQRYYDEECARMLAPSEAALKAAGVTYAVHMRVGPIAETIVDQAGRSQCEMICMGTRGATGLSNMLLGSVTNRVLHLATMAVLLVR
jgi:nucleotide-binding universal stress UspA family protein